MFGTFIFFENNAASISREITGYICLRVRPGKHTSGDIRRMFDQARQAMQRYDYTRLLIDQRQALMFSPADQHWFAQELLPLLAADKLVHRIAILQAHDVLARLSLLPLITGLHKQGSILRSFEAHADALAWLLEHMPAHKTT